MYLLYAVAGVLVRFVQASVSTMDSTENRDKIPMNVPKSKQFWNSW